MRPKSTLRQHHKAAIDIFAKTNLAVDFGTLSALNYAIKTQNRMCLREKKKTQFKGENRSDSSVLHSHSSFWIVCALTPQDGFPALLCALLQRFKENSKNFA